MSRVLTLEEMAAPGTPEHARLVTALKIPTILDLNRWETPSELWMVMSGMAEPEPLHGDHLDLGHDLEDGLVKSWRRAHPGWRTGPGEIAYTDEALPFANQATLDRRAVRGRARHIIECKTSASHRTWGDRPDGALTQEHLPAHVYVQVLAQMGISGIHRASVVALCGYDMPMATRLYEVAWDAALWEGIVEQTAAFVESLGEAESPRPPADLLRAVDTAQAPTVGEETVELTAGQVAEYHRLLEEKARVEAALEVEKRALEELAGGRKVIVGGKAFMSPVAGRFSARAVPKGARHLLKDPDVLTPKLDPAKLKAKYPEVVAAATGAPTYRFRKAA
ncbi:YqaJ viral recombinase family protein [Corynebacterium mastitidis]|uniref:YqaJ viral recombinase family protein n=1 Tax=Corynebacterium mastitidis TaxID=161890 RepID=A0ABU8P0W0_9CORY